MDKIKYKYYQKIIYNKIVDEISDMVWTNHYSLICEVMNEFDNKINEEDYDDWDDDYYDEEEEEY